MSAKRQTNVGFIIGMLVLLFGAIVPSMLFPNENQILVGFIGAPFVLIGLIVMLAASFPTQRLEDRDRKDDDKRG